MGKIKRAQISTEYLIIAAFVIILVISVLGIGMFYSGQARDRIKFNQIQNFANKIISGSESVYYSGEPSKITLSVYLPPGVGGIEILNDQIIFNVTSESGFDRISFPSNVPLEGSINNIDGVKRVVITAQADKVLLSG